MKPALYRLTALVGLALASGPVALAAPAGPSTGCDPSTQTVAGGAACAKGTGTPSDLFSKTGAFHVVADTLIFIVGAVSVIMLIIGGLRYVISQGDSAAVTQAKDTILYAVIGIVVAILAFAIVSFVAGALAPSK